MKKKSPSNNTVLYLSTFPPRECGIATFTQDLTEAMDKWFNPAVKSSIVALNETPFNFYRYGKKVVNDIPANNLEHYVALAQHINERDDVKLVNIQHEFGLFGGEWGDYLIPFLQVVKKPVVTTFHSVLPNPTDHLMNVVRFICEKSAAVIVMNSLSKETLSQTYGIPKSKIFLTSHGIPDTTLEPSEKYKELLGLKGKLVLSTFGLLSRDKGIEYALRALPRVIRRFPHVIYLVLGATHPVVRRQEGEAYRNFLVREVEQLKLRGHVKFYNKYLSLDEVITYLKATDLYISPTVTKVQSVSGTLAYALGCGRPVVATSTEYSKYLVRKDFGVLVKCRNSHAIANAILELLRDEKRLKSMCKQAYEATRYMTWSNVAGQYFRLYAKIANIKSEEKKLPEVKLDHLRRLTDSFGIIHHARYSKPEKRFGYSMDDNARALIAVIKYYCNSAEKEKEVLSLMETYLKFIKFVQRAGGSFANIVSSRRKRDGTKDEDVQGRGVWALGYAASCNGIPHAMRKEAERMFFKALDAIRHISSPRATAFAMTGLYYYLKQFPRPKVAKIFRKLADRQVELYKNTASPDWQWFEDHLTYSNSKLPESLFYAYDITKRKKYLDIAVTSLKFLSRITFEPRYYSPIGQNGWYFRYGKRAYFDQHPEDVAAMVETKLVAYKITGDSVHLNDAIKAFRWFLGRNYLEQMMYNENTGGCHDGLGKEGINLNQGAESTISYLLARLAFEDEKIKNALRET